MKITFLAAMLLLTGALTNVYANDNQWKLSGQIRHRYEASDRQFDAAKYSTYNLFRTRLNVSFTPTEDVKGYIQLQDSRVFGEEKNTLLDGTADRFDLHQGYIRVSNLFTAPLDLKLGRMEVNYGPQRLVGAVGWHNIGRAFDGVIITLRTKLVSLDLFNFAEVESLMAGDEGDLNFFGAYAGIHTTERYTNQVFLLWQRKNPSERLNRYTVGFYSNGKLGGFYHETEAAYQAGDITSAFLEEDETITRVQQDVRAYMAALNVGYKLLDVAYEPNGSIGVDLLSGDDNIRDATFRVFDTLYATNHKYYGYMDYFLVIPLNTFGLGLVDSHVRLSAKPQKDTIAKLAVHNFRSHRSYELTNGSRSNAFGTEVDLTLGYKYTDALTLTGGASAFWPGDIFIENEGGDRTTAWFYIMTTLTL